MTIRVQRGQSVKWRLALAENGVPIDLSGGAWEVLEPLSRPIVTIEASEPSGGISLLRIDKEETKALKPGQKIIRSRFIFPDGTAIAMAPITFEVK